MKTHMQYTKARIRQMQKLRIRILQLHQQRKEEKQARKQAKRICKQIRKARGQHRWYEHQHILPLMRHLLPCFILALSCLKSTKLQAQILENLFTEDTSIDSIPTKSLRAEVDAVAFFHDNEYKSDILKGYSLPGVRITPHLAFNPHKQVNIEAGASMLIFNGANKYPCYAYHDIGTWKGNQYQRGAHVLPWVRLQAALKHVDVVLGNIYGGSNHQLSAPLFNAEQNLSADPEMGAQILVHRKHFQSDTWLNWQSYIFEQDSHQEAFTVGENMQILWGKGDGRWRWYTPFQVTIQHRGGEQDTTHLGVQTLCNAALGLGVKGLPSLKNVDDVTMQLSAVGSYQQSGHIWPFDTGLAYHASASMQLLGHIHLAADYLYAPKQFITTFGNPLFSTISLRHPGTTYHGTSVLRIGGGYQYTFAKDYTLGVHGELFSKHSPARNAQPSLSELNFSFGLYFRVAPSILIKKF